MGSQSETEGTTQSSRRRGSRNPYRLLKRERTPELARGLGYILYQAAFTNISTNFLTIEKTPDGKAVVPQDPLNRPGREYAAKFLEKNGISPDSPFMDLMNKASIEIATTSATAWTERPQFEVLGWPQAIEEARQIAEKGLDAPVSLHRAMVNNARGDVIYALPLG